MSHPDAGRLHGLLTAILTPFDRSGRMALEQMPALLDFQRRAGIDGVIVCGTNGEGTSLSASERMRTLEAVMAWRDELLVIAATGASSVTDAVELTRHADEVGVDAVLALPPFFFKSPTAEGLAAYFRPVLNATRLPVLLYNIPQQSSIAISDELLERLSDCENLAGIKDSAGDWQSTAHYIERYPQLRIFAGSDRLAARVATSRAAGSISGGANAFPEVIAAVRSARDAGDNQGIEAAQERIDTLMAVTSRYPLIAVSKSVIAHRGLPRLSVRPPLIDLTPAQEEGLLGELYAAGFLQDT